MNSNPSTTGSSQDTPAPIIRPRPWITYTILGVTVFVFVLQIASQALFKGYDYPAIFGLKYNAAIQAGQVWRLFTPMLLHANLIHITLNMYALYSFGRQLEAYYGPWRFLALYIIAGFAGNVVSFMLSDAPSLGASTAVFGLAVAEAVFIFLHRQYLGGQSNRMLMNILVIIGINLVYGSVNTQIDNWGHIGGLLGGLGFAWFAGPLLVPSETYSGPSLVDAHSPDTVKKVAVIESLVIAALAVARILKP